MSEEDHTHRDEDARSLIDRALAVLGTFQGGRTRQSLSDISRRTGLPVTTCHRIVGRLTRWGALERVEGGGYEIGLRLWEIASRAPRSAGLQRIARPYLQDLYETTRYPCHLAVREGAELVSIERFQDPRSTALRPVVGNRYPMHATALGQVLLANAPEEIREEVLSGALEAFTKRTCVDRGVLERLLTDIRRSGYAVSDRQVDETHIGVAAPIHGADGSVVAGVSLVVAEKKRVDGSALIHLVKLTAASISRALDAPALRGAGR